MNQELFAFLPGADSITKPPRRRNIRLSSDHEGNGLWFEYSAAGGFMVGTRDCRRNEPSEIRHSTNLASDSLSSQLPVTDFFLFVIVRGGCATFEFRCPNPFQA